MDKSNSLIGGLISIALGIFALYKTYKYLKMGKMREVSIFRRHFYSFKRQPKEAYRTMIINCIAGIIGIIAGIGLLLVYFGVIR